MKTLLHISSTLLVVLLMAFSTNSLADFDSRHKLVIQVSTDDPRTQKMALNNVVNLQKHYGIDNIDIEIVAYGPGLGLVTSESPEAARVSSLTMQQVTFTACGNTMDTINRKTGKMPELIDGVGQFPAGVARIIELQEQGYAYVRP
jgi:intracellular sulfur oxidation DsrE/DsrF family protein